MQVEPRRLKDILDERGVHLNYDPERQVYTPWYRLPHKVSLEGSKFVKFNLSHLFCGLWLPFRIYVMDPFKFKEETKEKVDDLLSKQGNKKESLDEKIAGILIHESGHADTAPFTLPLQLATSVYLASFVGSDNQVLDCAAKIFTFFGINRLASIFFTEIPNEIYTYIRYGYNSFSGFKSYNKIAEPNPKDKAKSIEQQLIELRDNFVTFGKKTWAAVNGYLRSTR